ncbi:hypothetical protein [Streptomyces sp. NBC_00631]|uniref:hypothetical protein n=1 Tax=Streptomyces sp. NBC_00631 TaxID=2975793 RepID=UPI003867CAF8
MRDFHTRVLGLTVTDEDEELGHRLSVRAARAGAPRIRAAARPDRARRSQSHPPSLLAGRLAGDRWPTHEWRRLLLRTDHPDGPR